jgi:hypothetical protein
MKWYWWVLIIATALSIVYYIVYSTAGNNSGSPSYTYNIEFPNASSGGTSGSSNSSGSSTITPVNPNTTIIAPPNSRRPYKQIFQT